MTHNLLFYPSTLPGEPLERYCVEGMTLHEWMQKNVTGYSASSEHPISAMVNGVVVDPEHWDDVVFGRDTLVEIRPQPQGIETIIYAVVAAVVAVAASILLKPDIPTQANKSSGRGSKLLEANASGNQVALGDVIPEIAGRRKRFPDYLNSPRRVFDSTRTRQTMRMLLSVGRGEYEILPEDIFIGNTPFNSLGSAISYEVFPPGALVSGNSAHQNWFNVPEVGPAVGSSGIPLQSSRDAAISWGGELSFAGNTITSTSGDTPDGWSSGLSVYIELRQSVSIVDGGGDNADVITGAFRWLGLREGDTFTIDIYPDSYLRVATLDPGTGPDDDVVTLRVLVGLNWVPANNFNPGNENWIISPDRRPSYLITEAIPNGFEFQGRVGSSNIVDWPGFPTTTTSNATVEAEVSEGEGVWTLPFAVCPKGEVTESIEWDVFAPQGLVESGESSGNRYPITRTVQMRYREVGSAAWEGVVSRDISGETRDQLGWTFSQSLPRPMRAEVQVRRLTSSSDNVLIQDSLEFYGLRSRLPAPNRYEGVTTLAVTITGSDQISSRTDNQINVICTRKIPVRSNGSWTHPQVTRDIAPWFAYIAKDAGYSDDDLDLDELDRLDAIWKSRGDTFDYIEADDSTVKEALVRALRAGMAEATIRDGLLTPVRDGPRTQVEHVYSAQNFIEEFTYDISMPHPTDTDGIDVEYVDSENWTEAEVKCRLPGDNGFKTEKVRLDGVTSREQAYQIGMRERRKIKYRRSSYRFATELDALNSHYMGYNAIISDVPGQGQSMLCDGVQVVDANRVTVQVTEPLDWSADEPHVVAWRRPDGTMSGPYQAIEGSHEFEVTMFSSDGVEPPVVDVHMEWPHVYFGPESTWKHAVLITSIEPQGFESVSVQAVNYDDRVYLDDDSQPPPA